MKVEKYFEKFIQMQKEADKYYYEIMVNYSIPSYEEYDNLSEVFSKRVKEKYPYYISLPKDKSDLRILREFVAFCMEYNNNIKKNKKVRYNEIKSNDVMSEYFKQRIDEIKAKYEY